MKKLYPSSARFKTPEYWAWANMKSRCYNPKRADWKYYGAKGITVCERWVKSFTAFLEDMGPRPSALHSIDRFPDGEGNYEPGNCRWATSGEQSSNRSSVRFFDYHGDMLPLAEICRREGLPYLRVFSRLERGHDIQTALSSVKLVRDLKTYCRGERSGVSKLSEVQVRHILATRPNGRKLNALADELGVYPQSLYDILAGKRWKYLQREQLS